MKTKNLVFTIAPAILFATQFAGAQQTSRDSLSAMKENLPAVATFPERVPSLVITDANGNVVQTESAGNSFPVDTTTGSFHVMKRNNNFQRDLHRERMSLNMPMRNLEKQPVAQSRKR